MSNDVAEELNQIANIQGKTLYSLINELTTFGIEAYRQGFSIKEAIEAKTFLNKAIKSRLLFVNQDMWYNASSIIYKKNKEEWLNQAYEKAKWYGKVFLGKIPENIFIEMFREALKKLFLDCNEIYIKKEEKDTYNLKAIFSPEMPLQHTFVIMRMIEGLLNSSGYAILKYTVEQGYISMMFRCLHLPE